MFLCPAYTDCTVLYQAVSRAIKICVYLVWQRKKKIWFCLEDERKITVLKKKNLFSYLT